MGQYKKFQIDRKDGWKFKTTSGTNGEDFSAQVYVDDNGEISRESYSDKYLKELDAKDDTSNPKDNDQNGNDNGKNGKGKDQNGKDNDKDDKKDGCLTKIIKAPFRLIWWLIKFLLKNALVILTFGIANGWFDDKEK